MEDVLKETAQENPANYKKLLRAFHASSIREVTERANQLITTSGLSKEDIMQVVHTEDGFFLLYYL